MPDALFTPTTSEVRTGFVTLAAAERRAAELRARVDDYRRRIVSNERLLGRAERDLAEAWWVLHDARCRVTACPDCGADPGEPCLDAGRSPLQREPGRNGSSMHHSIRGGA